jgi:hypothetical protein
VSDYVPSESEQHGCFLVQVMHAAPSRYYTFVEWTRCHGQVENEWRSFSGFRVFEYKGDLLEFRDEGVRRTCRPLSAIEVNLIPTTKVTQFTKAREWCCSKDVEPPGGFLPSHQVNSAHHSPERIASTELNAASAMLTAVHVQISNNGIPFSFTARFPYPYRSIPAHTTSQYKWPFSNRAADGATRRHLFAAKSPVPIIHPSARRAQGFRPKKCHVSTYRFPTASLVQVAVEAAPVCIVHDPNPWCLSIRPVSYSPSQPRKRCRIFSIVNGKCCHSTGLRHHGVFSVHRRAIGESVLSVTR